VSKERLLCDRIIYKYNILTYECKWCNNDSRDLIFSIYLGSNNANNMVLYMEKGADAGTHNRKKCKNYFVLAFNFIVRILINNVIRVSYHLNPEVLLKIEVLSRITDRIVGFSIVCSAACCGNP
jgi:hypothetical protein